LRNRIFALIGLLAISIGVCLRSESAPPLARAQGGGPIQLLGVGGINRADVNSSNELLVHPTSGYATLAKQDSLIALYPTSLDSNNFRVAIENTPAVTISGTPSISISAPSATFQGQKKIAVTGTAVAISSSQALTQGVLITAFPGNVNDLYIGDSGVNNTAPPSGNGYVLKPGQSVRLAGNNANLWYINGTANDYISWIGN
jgi:hypothetical protein